MLNRTPLRVLTLLAVVSLTPGCGSTNHLVFTTHTKAGLDITATNGTPSGLMFGYKRFEGAIVPVDTKGALAAGQEPKMMSIYASLDLNNGWFQGISIFQVFATGRAAENAAANPSRVSDYIDSLRPNAEQN